MANAAGIRPVMAQIGELAEGVEQLKTDVKAIDLKSGMMRTFEAAECAALKGKLERAKGCLEAARDAKEMDEAGWQSERAARILNDVAVVLALESAEFRRELIGFRSRRRYDADLARYDRSVERAHETFLTVANLVTAVVTRIPKLG